MGPKLNVTNKNEKRNYFLFLMGFFDKDHGCPKPL